jgi:hypothetical protein
LFFGRSQLIRQQRRQLVPFLCRGIEAAAQILHLSAELLPLVNMAGLSRNTGKLPAIPMFI